jgi:C4-dicarboxylate-specific signal transduction histidine kinase
MAMEGTALAFASSDSRGYPLAGAFDLNQTLRRLVYYREHELRHRNIAVVLDLSPELPKSTANSCQIEKVLFALFMRAQKAIADTGRVNGTIRIRTERKGGNIQVSISDNGIANPFTNVFQDFFKNRVGNSADLAVCAEIVQDQAGELYGWHLRGSSFITILMDLPV